MQQCTHKLHVVGFRAAESVSGVPRSMSQKNNLILMKSDVATLAFRVKGTGASFAHVVLTGNTFNMQRTDTAFCHTSGRF